MLTMNKEEESEERNYVSLPVVLNPTPRTIHIMEVYQK